MGAKQVELKFSGIDEFEEPLAIAHPGRHDPDFIFVNQAMLDQGPIKLADAILNDVLAWLLLCLGNCRRYVSVDKGSVPTHIFERSRGYKFWESIDTIKIRIALNSGPSRRQLLVGHSPEQKQVNIGKLLHRIFHTFLVKERKSPPFRRADYSIQSG